MRLYKVIKLGGTACLCVSLAAAAFLLLLFGAVQRAAASVRTEPPAADERRVPIIMYHSVVKDASLTGDYVITAAELETDLRYLKENGYTSVFCSELADYVNGTADLPDKPVVLSFDDGCYNNFYYVLPLIESCGFKAVFAPVGQWTEQAAAEEQPSCAYSYMDAENLRSCALSGRIEIADHTYSMHDLTVRKGVLRRSGEDGREYRRIFWSDLDRSRRIIEKITGAPPVTLAYPYGFCDDETEQLAAELGYEVTLGCEEKVNTVTPGDRACLSRMGRFNRASGRTAEQILSEKC